MWESGYYPAGAENDSRAPYNQPVEEDYDFVATCSFFDDNDKLVDTRNEVITLTLECSPESYKHSELCDMLRDELIRSVGDCFEILNFRAA